VLAVAALGWAAPSQAMNKAELIDAIASGAKLTKADAGRALDGFIAATTKALKKGDRISLVGFGSFSTAGRVASPEGCTSLNEADFYAGTMFRSGENPLYQSSGNGVNNPLYEGKRMLVSQVFEYQGAVLVYGGTNGAEFKDGDSPIVHKRAGRASVDHGGIPAVVVGVVNLSPDGKVSLDKSGQENVVGLLLSGITTRDVAPGDYVSSRESADACREYLVGNGSVARVVQEDELSKLVAEESRLTAGAVSAALSTLKLVISDQVNRGALVDLGGFGSFAEEVQLTVALDDPCAGVPENCPPTNASADGTVYPYIDWSVTVSATGLSVADLLKLRTDLETAARRAARIGRNPQTGKEIKISAKKVVKFKAGAELASKVN